MSTINRAKFITAGRAVFTVVSKKTGARFTYRVREGAPLGSRAPKLFASVLSGPDNTADYTYLGMIETLSDGTPAQLVPTRASAVATNAPSFRALEWLLRNLDSDQVEFHHCGRCARCGRALTVPSSIASGFGPECAGKAGL